MIVFDLQAVQSAAHGERGIARYVADLATSLVTHFPDAVDVFAFNDALPTTASVLTDPALVPRLRSFSELRGGRVGVLHTNSPFELLDHRSVSVPVSADRVVVSCYDLIPCVFPDVYLTDAPVRARYRTRLTSLLAADAVVTDSLSARNDVVRLLGVDPGRVTVIGGSVGDQFTTPETTVSARLAELRRRHPDLRSSYVMVPSGADWRKNNERVLAAYARLAPSLRSEHQLVVTCKLTPVQRAELEAHTASLGVADDVLFTGLVSDDDLVLLYQTAELVVFASLYEGFGLPVLEARRCGAPVICSNTSSLPEVLPDAEATFDPHDVASIAGRLERALTDVAFMAHLRSIDDAGHTWSSAAERLAGVYHSLANRSHVATRRRRSLGVVTVIPPTKSGIADHSDRVLSALVGHRDDVDLVVFTDTDRGVPTPYRLAPLAALPAAWAGGELDAVVYVIGNNVYHRPVLPMLGIVPGHVLVHDLHLGGLFGDSMGDVVSRWYGDGQEDGSVEPLGLRAIAADAMSILVQSAHAADLARLDLAASPVAATPIVDVGPISCAPVEICEDHGNEVVPSLVVTAGIADERKLTDRFVAASRCSTADTQFAIVGLGGDRFVTPDDEVVVTGAVDDSEFFDWIARATVLVQLRSQSQGESSGVVAHALARGVPTIVSDIGALSELPDDVVVKVAVDTSASELAVVIDGLLGDRPRRDALAAAARRYAKQETPAAQADRIVSAALDV